MTWFMSLFSNVFANPVIRGGVLVRIALTGPRVAHLVRVCLRHVIAIGAGATKKGEGGGCRIGRAVAGRWVLAGEI